MRTGSSMNIGGSYGVNTVYENGAVYAPGGAPLQHFFPGLSEHDNLVLNSHPEFAHNPFHLTGEQLVRTLGVHNHNIAQIYEHNPRGVATVWNEVKGVKASELLSKKNGLDNPLKDYLHRLQEVTHLDPRGGIFRRHETVNDYMARAEQWAAKHGKLKDVNLELE
jgi:hypothetical protein